MLYTWNGERATGVQVYSGWCSSRACTRSLRAGEDFCGGQGGRGLGKCLAKRKIEMRSAGAWGRTGVRHFCQANSNVSSRFACRHGHGQPVRPSTEQRTPLATMRACICQQRALRAGERLVLAAFPAVSSSAGLLLAGDQFVALQGGHGGLGGQSARRTLGKVPASQPAPGTQHALAADTL
jgi:hypothetical protein